MSYADKDEVLYKRLLEIIWQGATDEEKKDRQGCFEKNRDKVAVELEKWLVSGDDATISYALHLLWVGFLSEEYIHKHIELVASIKSENEDVNENIVGYFSAALGRFWKEAFPYIALKRLKPCVHNRVINRAIKLYLVTDDKGALLKKFEIKES